MSFNNRVRKAVGFCYNQLRTVDQITSLRVAPASALTFHAYPFINRVISQHWHRQRDWYLASMYTLMTQAQINANQHLYCVGDKTYLRVANTSAPSLMQYEIYKITIKCNEGTATAVAPSAGQYKRCTGVTNATDPALNYKFWDSLALRIAPDGVVTNNTGSDPGYATDGTTVAGNVGVVVAEAVYQAAVQKEKLSFLYPTLKRYCKIRKVGSGLIKSGRSKLHVIRNRVLGEIKPQNLLDDTMSYLYGGVSHFYYIRARNVLNCAGNNNAFAAAGSWYDQSIPAAGTLSIVHWDITKWRITGDSKPTFALFNYKDMMRDGAAPTTFTELYYDDDLAHDNGNTFTYDAATISAALDTNIGQAT